LKYTQAENMAALITAVENKARIQHPLNIPIRSGIVGIYGSPYQSIQGTDFSALLYENGEVAWGRTICGSDPETIHTGWVGLYAEVYNLTMTEAAFQLAARYGINPEKPLEQVDGQSQHAITGNAWPLPNGDCTIDGVTATCVEIIPVAYPRRDIQYLVAVLQTDSDAVSHKPYFMSNDRDPRDPNAYTWGFFPNAIPLYGLDVLERYQSATVIFTDDIWLAHRINSTLSSLNEPNHAGVVAVAIWVGTSRITDYSLLPLRGRDVVYIPTLHRDSLVVGVELRELLNKVGVENFKVLMQPFANSADTIKAARTDCGDDACEWAMELTRRNLICLLDDIQNAWPFSRYKEYCRQEKFIEMEQQPSERAEPSLFMSASDISTAANRQGRDASFSMNNIFAYSNITVIVGESDAGKTMFTRTIALSMATGTDALGMTVSKARNVYSVNAEQDVEKSDTYTRRAMTALGIKEYPSRFYDMPELSIPTPDGYGPLDVLDPKWQDYLLKAIAHGSKLIVDNLLAASGKDLAHASVARALRAFAKRLQEKQISLIVIHHTGKDKDAMGSKALESLSQNFIMIHQAEQREGFEGGVNAVVTFRKIKDYPQYKGKQFHAHLEYAAGEEGTPWVFEEVDTDSLEAKPAPRTKPDVRGLHKIKRAALLHAYEHGKVTKSNVVDKDFKDGTVKDHLADLVKANQLEQKGSGPGTYYVLPEATS
jgi:hypothetical protein